MKIENRQKIAKEVNGQLGVGLLNWMGDFDMATKRNQFSIFFNKESQAKKALLHLRRYGEVKLLKTPKFVNIYFKFSVTIIDFQ